VVELLVDTVALSLHSATITYGYDATDRLTLESRTGYQPIWYEYTLDGAGNRTTFTEKDPATGQVLGTTNATYSADNRLLTYGNTSYTWDGNGNQLTKTTNNVTVTHGWNYENKLVSLTDGHTMSFSYNGDGLRQTRTVDGTTTQYVYDGVRLLKELDANGATQTTYTLAPMGDDEWYPLLSDRASGASRFYAFDALGTTRALSDQQSAVSAVFTDDAWGNVLSASDPDATPHQYIGKLGYYADVASGLNLLTQRHYDSGVGGFASQDPVAHGLNWWQYASSAPSTATDPAGEFPLVCFTACACAGIGTGYAAAGCYDGCRNAVDPSRCWGTCMAEMARDSDWRVRMTEACMAGCAVCVARHMAEAMRRLRPPNPPPVPHPPCFVAGTLVWTAEGAVPIERVRAGDLVLSKDAGTGEVSYRKVLRTSKKPASRLIQVRVGESTVTTTPDHPFWVQEKGWTRAEALRAGDRLLLRDGTTQELTSRSPKTLADASVPVYNLEVERTLTPTSWASQACGCTTSAVTRGGEARIGTSRLRTRGGRRSTTIRCGARRRRTGRRRTCQGSHQKCLRRWARRRWRNGDLSSRRCSGSWRMP